MSVADAVKENRPVIEYSISQGQGHALSMKSELILEDSSVTSFQKKYRFQTSRGQLNESITVPSRMTFISNNLFEIHKIYQELNFNNSSVIESSFKILEKCSLNGKTDIKTSKTAQGEILIYRKKGDSFSNLLIDEDGDVSFMKFGKSQNEKRVEFFSSETKLDYNKIVSLL